jgi:hypothetical protein
MQITAISTDIPPGFPIRASRMTISYGYAEVGGKRYLLPSLAISETSTATTSHQNRIEFRKYSKFSTDSSISFEEDQENP